MTFGVDDRGRVPFALIGVILLVTSAAYATGLGPDPTPDHPHTEPAFRQAQATAQALIHAGVRRAARQAAANPLIRPANTSMGRRIAGEDPFRRYLRVLIYHHVRGTLAAHRVRSGAVFANVSMDPIANASDVDRAIERVTIRAVGGGRAMDVRIANVSVRLSRDGKTIAGRRYRPRVRVRTPVLALHDAMTRYQRRASASRPAQVPRRVTRSLYLLAWARGYAQYVGRPITNVVGNRDLEVLVNRAMLAEQRAVFGTADRDSYRALAAGLRGTGRRLLTLDTQHVGPLARLLQDPRSVTESSRFASPGLGSTPNVTVGVNGTADVAFRALVANDSRGLRTILRTRRSGGNDSGRRITDAALAAASRDLAALRDRIRSVRVHVSMQEVLRNPPAAILREQVQRMDSRLRWPNTSMSALSDTERAAIRGAYLRAVQGHLQQRANRSRRALANVKRRVTSLRSRIGELGATPSLLGSPGGSPIVQSVNATPIWIHPGDPSAGNCSSESSLTVENVNWFTTPAFDATSSDTVSVGAGLPITPVPAHWYATVNGWTVRIRARYHRLAIAAPAATPSPSSSITYVRHNASIRLDLDGDDTRERLGRTTPIRAAFETSVIVVVPPGRAGVGDHNARTERSPAAGRNASSSSTSNRSSCSQRTFPQMQMRGSSWNDTDRRSRTSPRRLAPTARSPKLQSTPIGWRQLRGAQLSTPL